MAEKVCESCGRANGEDARFCAGCARPLDESVEPAAAGSTMVETARDVRKRVKVEAAEARARAKAARPFWRKKRFLLPVGLGVIIGIAVAAGGGGGETKTAKHPATEDVSISSCTVDSSTQWAKAVVHVVNNSSKASDYFVTVQMETADGSLWDTAYATVTALAPGQSTDEPAQSLKTPAPAGVSCRVQDADRHQTLARD
jgi:hypothetical protein